MFTEKEERDIGFKDLRVEPEPEVTEINNQGFFGTAKASFLNNFFIGKTYNYQMGAFETNQELMKQQNNQPEFNPLEEKYLDLVDSYYWPDLSKARTESELYRIVERINVGEEQKKIINEGSTLGALAGGLLAGALDPYTYLFPVKALKTAYLVPGLKSYITTALPSIAAGFAAHEANMMLVDETRKLEESIHNVAVGTILGGLLGMAGVGARTLKYNVYKEILEHATDGKQVKFSVGPKGEMLGLEILDEMADGSLSSAKTIRLDKDELWGWGKNGELKPATPFVWMTAKLFRNPVLLGMTSKFKSIRRFTDEALEHNFTIAKNIVNKESHTEALQTKIWGRMSQGADNEIKLANAYYEYLGVDPDKSLAGKTISGIKKEAYKKGNFDKFMEDVYSAVLEGGSHSNGVISREANRIIKEIIEPTTKELQDLGLLEKDIKVFGSSQYMMRLYNREYITANRPTIQKFLLNKFSDVNQKVRNFRRQYEKDPNFSSHEFIKLKLDSGELTRDMLTKDGKELKLRADLSEADLSSSAKDTIDTILSLTEEQLHTAIAGPKMNGSGVPNILMERSLMINDADLLKAGMLVKDVRKNINAYVMRASRIIEMEKYLRSKGYTGEGPKLEFLTNEIKNEYDELLRKLESKHAKEIEKTTDKQAVEKKYQKKRLKLEKDFKDSTEFASNVYNRLMGYDSPKYGDFMRSVRFMQNWAYATQMGALALLCLQDAVVPIYRNGFLPYFNHGIKPFLHNLFTAYKNNKRLRKEAQDMAIGIETAQAFYSTKFDMGLDVQLPMNSAEKFMNNAAKYMSVLNFVNPWEDFWKHISSTTSQSRMIDYLGKFNKGKLKDKHLQQMLVAGIDPKKHGDIILEQFAKYGENLNGSYLPNFHLWDNNEAKRIFQNAIKKEVNSTIFSGSNIASYPLGANPKGISGALLMYMGWGFQATANYLVPLLQKYDFNKCSGIAMMMATSALVEPLRKISKGEEPDLEPAHLFQHALLNSGVLGTFGDVFNRINAIGNLFPGLNIDRFKHAGRLMQFAPESILQSGTSVAGMFINQEWNKKDWKKALNMVPLSSLIYLRRFENDLIDSFDIPETRQKAEKLKEWR